MSRHSSDVGKPMLVTLPAGPEWRDTGEGGLAFFLVVPALDGAARRQTCMAGQLIWPDQDCPVGADTDPVTTDSERHDAADADADPWVYAQDIDAGLLIGSTGQSLFNDTTGAYFRPGVDDLTDYGRTLHTLLATAYGTPPSIVTLLDT